MTLLKWQTEIWQRLWEAKQKQCLPHAIAISGVPGIGKAFFANAFAQAILCSNADLQGVACHQCHACHLIQAGSHPDLIHIAAESPGQVIKAEQIREMVHFVNETSMQQGYKIAIIHQAQDMNHYAANALLKTLEEPPHHTLFILLSGEGQCLPATISSRCHKLTFHLPEKADALLWLQSQLPESHSFTSDAQEIALKMTGGAPFKALSFLTHDMMAYRQTIYDGLAALWVGHVDPLQLAAKWHEQELSTWFQLLFYWVHDVLKLKLTRDISVIVNSDYQEILLKITEQIDKQKILTFLSEVQKRYAKISASLNLNRQLLLEELLIRWSLMNRIVYATG